MAVSFIDCPPASVGALRTFFSEMYSPEYVLSRDEGFVKWQFGPTPASRTNDYHLILGVVDGAIKGCIGYIPVDLSVAGRVVRAAWAANWMVDQTTRRLGLGPLLMRELTKRFEATLALGGNSDAHDLLPRMGWTDFGGLARFVRVLNPEAAGLVTESGRIDWPGAPHDRLPCPESSVMAVTEFSDEVAPLWDRVWGATGAGTRRSAEFLNWRYAAHPNFTHRLFECRCDGRLRAVAVSRIERVRDMDVRIGRILELMGEPAYIPALLACVLEDARGADAAAVDFFCASRQMADALHAAGFLPGETPPGSDIPILFQPVDRSRTGILFMAHLQKVPEAAGVQDWYVTKSDGDQDRPS